jgi:ribonuclease-3
MVKSVEKIEKILNYNFKNKDLAAKALTHTSCANKHHNKQQTFEELEFLGDRVLGLSVSELWLNFLLTSPNAKSNTQSIMHYLANGHACFVATDFLDIIASEWQIQKLLSHSIQKISKKTLADTVESLLGAIFLDSDYMSARNIIQQFWLPHFQRVNYDDLQSPKMQLQELSQSMQSVYPLYTILQKTGLVHAPQYTIQVEIPNLGKAIGKGESKDEASKNAAKKLLEQITTKR